MTGHRRRATVVVAAIAFAACVAGCTPAAQNGETVSAPAVVPAPASIQADTGAAFTLDAKTQVEGEADAAAALTAIVKARTGLTLQTSDRGGIQLAVKAGGPSESYRLDASADGVTVTGADAAGLFYGVQTLSQLIARHGDGWEIPAVTIQDAPRFSYRGVMLDVARHFQTVDTVKAYIDRAAGLKFNALHLHLSDDQGWRIQLGSRPKLTELASATSVGGDPGGFYTKDDYREIVAYAASRHMIVVPELDMPGHTHAVGLAYPEIEEAPVPNANTEAGGRPPVAGQPYEGIGVGFSSLKIHDEATYDFVADVFGGLASMTPGPYLHFGGDESLSTDPADFADFVTRVSDIIADLGKTPIAWHEAGAAPELNDETIGQYWGFLTPTDGMDVQAKAFVDHGSKLILSPADAIYLDMKYDGRTPLGLTWANGPTSVERAYSWEPSKVIAGIQDSDILGVEAPMWTETIKNLDDIDGMAFPRIAAAAEAAWSPATASSPLRTWDSFRERVGTLGPLWTSLGIHFSASDEIPWSTQ
jgi:hexosaminidase